MKVAHSHRIILDVNTLTSAIDMSGDEMVTLISNKGCGEWGEVPGDNGIASAVPRPEPPPQHNRECQGGELQVAGEEEGRTLLSATGEGGRQD